MVFEHSDMPPPPLPNDKPKKKWRQDKKQRKKVDFIEKREFSIFGVRS